MESAIFEEHQEIKLRGPLAFASGAAFFVIPLFTTMPLLLILVMFTLGVGMSYLISSIMQMHTLVTATMVTFGPSIWTRTLPVNEIVVIGPHSIPFLAGVGIHRYCGKTYFNVRYGKGLEVKHGTKTYVIGSSKLEELQSALRNQARSISN